MSSSLALAGVTAVLKDLLNDGLVDSDAQSVAGPVKVTAVAPDRIVLTGVNAANQINIFLYHVSPNAAMRNMDLPMRDSSGQRVSNQPLALDLHYLVTAFGTQDMVPEILLGYAMHILHEKAILTSETIRASFTSLVNVVGANLPPGAQTIKASDLADQIESIKITPHTLNSEEISRLWSAFQVHYRPSVAYQVSVVLIQGKKSTKTALPVTNPKLYTMPFETANLESADPQIIAYGPVMKVKIKGQGIGVAGQVAVVNKVSAPIDPALSKIGEITVDVPASTRAGVNAFKVLRKIKLEDGTERIAYESNPLPFLVVPAIKTITLTLTGAGSTPRSGKIKVKLDPPVLRDQAINLLLNQSDAVAPVTPLSYNFIGPDRGGSAILETDTIEFDVAGLVPAKYLVRVSVEGATSLLTADAQGKFVGPEVTVT